MNEQQSVDHRIPESVVLIVEAKHSLAAQNKVSNMSTVRLVFNDQGSTGHVHISSSLTI